jgi:PKD repeat protein
MVTDSNGIPSFEYGKFGVPLDATNPNPNANTPVKLGDADSGNYNVETGVITIKASNSKLENIHAGQGLQALNVRTYFVKPAAGPRSQNIASDITGDSSYTLVGNAACLANQAPIAQLLATPIEGNPPLTVNFNGSASADPDAGDSIASYTFSFGDGSPDVTQSSPTISHVYTHGGGFFATLTVKDSHGLQSANVASADIKVAAQLFNLSTRLQVQPGDNALIGGFIIKGSEPKKVVLRGLGPSLNVPGKLEDPVIQLYNSSNVNIGGNDDWKTDEQNVESTGLAPTNDRESALVITLNPGTYTVVMHGKNNGSGIGVVEVYDVNLAANSRLANISSRGFIGINDNVLIGGFFAGPQTAAVTGVVFRALGPSLSKLGVPQAMQDPMIEIHNANGDVIASNDDWETSQKSEIQAAGLAPSDSRESAIVMKNFDPGPYTAIVRGKNGSVGNGLIEIYDVQQ